MLSIRENMATEILPRSTGLRLLSLMIGSIAFGGSLLRTVYRIRGLSHTDLSIDVLLAVSLLGLTLQNYIVLRVTLRRLAAQSKPASD